MLSLAPVYRLAQTTIGAERFRDVVVRDYLRPTEQDRVLDIGCGTADILDHLPPLDYVGFDPSDRYVRDARDRFADRGVFVTTTADGLGNDSGLRTIAMAIGVLHHLDDEAAVNVLELAHSRLTAGGRFVSVDPTLVSGQHRIARFLVARDRGLHVRHPDGVSELVRSVFPDATISVRHDLLRVPYTHVIATATKST